MAESFKITEEELKVVQEQQVNYQKIIEQLGLSDVRKHTLLSQLDLLLPKIEENKQALEEKYGSININIQTGEYTEIEKDDDGETAVVKAED